MRPPANATKVPSERTHALHEKDSPISLRQMGRRASNTSVRSPAQIFAVDLPASFYHHVTIPG